MAYSVSCNPAPLTFTIRPRFGWQSMLGIAWICFIVYRLVGWRGARSYDPLDLFGLALISFSVLLSFIRRERIEIYPDQMVWRKTYFGLTHSKTAPLSDVLGAEWNEGEQQGRRGKGPDYVEFYLPNGSVKACYGFTFDDFDRMRNDIRPMYPDVIKRWGRPTTRSKTLTLLNLT
jgi:hypothetical protein